MFLFLQLNFNFRYWPDCSNILSHTISFHLPSIVPMQRGPGKLRRKRKRKVIVDDEDEWTPASRGSFDYQKERRTSLARALKKNTSYGE